MKKQITPQDIISLSEFADIRPRYRQEMISLKRNRRVFLGPHMMLHFENFHTLLWQVQEMLYIEKGGEEQLADELNAYNPLIPEGSDLVATVMLEIEDAKERHRLLHQLGNIETLLYLRIGDHKLQGCPDNDQERTNENGKTSSVHFIRWHFKEEVKALFKQPGTDVIVECTHPLYTHKVLMDEKVREALAGDFE